MQLGELVRDKLGDDKKAISIFERVLEMDADNMDALHAAADLYVKTGDHQRLAFADEKLLERESDPDERRVLMLQIASLYENHLDDAGRGFEWYRRAYLETPDAEGLQLVDQAAERHGLFEELIQIYEGARARAAEPIEQLAASLKIALICEEKLRDPARAFATLVEALPADPAGRELLSNLERLADQTKDWRGLLDVYARVARARTEVGERVELLRLRAEVRERQMSDPSGALDEMLRSFALAPESTATQEEILRLARATGRWEEAIRVEGHLFALAADAAREAEDRPQRRLSGRARSEGSGARLPRLSERLPAGARGRRDRRPPLAAGEDHRHLSPRSRGGAGRRRRCERHERRGRGRCRARARARARG